MEFIYSWRWFGPADRITLNQIRQTGATGIVNALHQIPVGDVWGKEAILERKNYIESFGLTWEVVESLPVSETIKMHKGQYLEHIENYKTSIENLAACGIKTICYNFMPVLDWSRTNLKVEFEDGTYTSGFDLHKFAAFDLFILKRSEAANDYPEDIIELATDFYKRLLPDEILQLKETILYGLPGSMQTYSIDEFKGLLANYAGIDSKQLKEHLKYFLSQIILVAATNGVKLAIHPDDPPWNLMGLPRIVSTKDDLKEIVGMVPSASNGITLCTGSLGAGYFNELPQIAEELAPFIHFVHLRNVIRNKNLSFREDALFEGDIDMMSVVKNLVKEGIRRKKELNEDWRVPIRPDHGHQILEDVGKENYPGYSLYGRMKNLAEIKGLTLGIISLME